MLSRTAEYAVRAVVVLARNHGESLSASEIASTLGAPRNYLSKTLSILTRRGILRSTRGPGGGYALAAASGSLSVADIADVFADGSPEHARCLLSDAPCDAQRPCAAHRRWVSITLGAREVLMRMPIGELCGEEETVHGDITSTGRTPCK